MNFERYKTLIFISAYVLIFIILEVVCYVVSIALSTTGVLNDGFEKDVVIENPYHPYIGHIHAPNIAVDTSKPGIDPSTVINTNDQGYSVTPWYEHKDAEIKIAIIGGSTVFGVGSSNNHWTVPSIIEKLANESTNKKIEVFNIALRGANSYQEMVILNRFLLEENDIDLVLSISGYNDAYQGIVVPSIEGRFLGWYRWELTAPIIHNLEKGTLNLSQIQPVEFISLTKAREFSYFIDFGYRFIRKIVSIAKGDPKFDWASETYNPSKPEISHLARTKKVTSAEQAINTTAHYAAMDAISRAFGARFIMFLQPTAYQKNELTDRENSLIDNYIKNRDPMLKEKIKKYYRQFSNLDADYTRIDLSDIFRSSTDDLFIDPCHWTDEACRLIAEAVYNEVAKVMAW